MRLLCSLARALDAQRFPTEIRLFQSTIALFDRYYRAVDSTRARGFNRELGIELRERLQQMDWLVSRVQELEQRADNATARSQGVFRSHVQRIQREALDYEAEPVPRDIQLTSTEAADMLSAEFEIKLHTESSITWRAAPEHCCDTGTSRYQVWRASRQRALGT
jgi:hypothetical protein